MLDKIMDEIKTRNEKLYIFILMIMLILLIAKFWDRVILINEILFKSMAIVLNHIVSSIFVIILIVFKIYIFKLSDEKSQEKIDAYNNSLIEESKNNGYFSVKLIERYEKLNKDYGNTLQIIINNNSDERIEYLKGYISLYKNFIKISQVNFEINHIDRNYGEKVYYDFIDHNKLFWDGFDIYVSKIKIRDKVEEGLFYKGTRFTRTHYLILNLNRFYDYKICGIRTKYNLIWLKENFRRNVLYRIRYFCSHNIIYLKKIPLIEYLKRSIFRLIRISLVITSVFTIFIGILLALLDVGDFCIDLFNLWKNYI